MKTNERQRLILTSEFIGDTPHDFYDGSIGGLVLGRRHSEGSIYGVRETNGGKMELIMNMEGGEYLMNAMATDKYSDRLNEINQYVSNEPEIQKDRIEKLSCVIDAGNNYGFIQFSNYDQFIVNRNATAKYLEELDEMNSRALAKYLAEKNNKPIQ
ncbi:hypothetical protein Barb6XT_03133 [Bacteroidales bacterium Barb6XT]|nr:hypothetical protein Barb6XT_03133 [Bacteroidales bacterium Barb6XT]